MINWILTNKDWLFSGVGIAVITIIFSFILKKRKGIVIKNTTVSDGFNVQISNVKGNIDISELNNAKLTEVAKTQSRRHLENPDNDTGSNENIIMIAKFEDITKYDTRVRKLIAKIIRDEWIEERSKYNEMPLISPNPPTPTEVRWRIEQMLEEIASLDKDKIIVKVCSEMIISQRRNTVIDHLKSTIHSMLTDPTIEDIINILDPERETQILHTLEFAGFIQSG